MFPANSRYHGIEIATYKSVDGREIAYLRRRFVPPHTATAVLAEHEVTQGDRLDIITARYIGDPELFWRVCDANNAMQPAELTDTSSIGKRLLIPMPQGGR